MAAAGRAIGLTRQDVAKRVSKDPELQRACQEVLEENKDKWEGNLEELAMDKNSVVAVLAKLNAYARDRGDSRTTADVNVSGHVEHDHRHLHLHEHRLQFKQLSDSDLERLIAERRAALPEPDADLIDIPPRALTWQPDEG